MPTNVKPTFFDQLRSSGLLELEQLKELAELPEAKQADPRPLARQVFQRGWLTKHQINQVVAGRAKELFIGPYILVDRLGEGGMGMVFKARHRHMGRVVALKLIRKEKLANPDAVQRFYREVQAAAQLVHPNIVLAFDAGQDGSTHFLSMEYVDGTDLARLVRESGPLPVAQACEYMRQAALGLQHAHERGLVHRDIKPHNLLLTRASGGRQPSGDLIKVLDMGLALRGGPDKERAMTQTGAVIGTPDFIAPEQAINSRAADIRADLYSLGCTFYFLLTGRALFLGESLTQVLLQHQLEEAAPLEQLRANTPPAVAAVVRKLMAKRPEDRFQTPAELVQVLEALAQGKTDAIQTKPVTPPAVLPVRTEPVVDSFWNTVVEGSDGPARVAEDADRTEAGERVVKGPRGKRAAAKEKTKSKGGLTRQQKIGLAVGGGVFAFLALLVVVIVLVSGGDKTDANTHRDDQVVKKGPDDKKGPGEKPKEPVAGGETRLFKGHTDRVHCVAFSPDGALALSGGDDKTLRLWDVATGKQLHRINDFKEGVKSVAFAPDGKRFFASTGEKGLREWNLVTREEIGTPRSGLFLSPYGNYGATINEVEQKPTVRVWNTRTQQVRLNASFPVTAGEVRVAFSAADRHVVLVGAEGSLVFCDLQSGQGRQFKVANGPSRCVAVSPERSLAVVAPEAAGRAAPVRVWSLTEERPLRNLEDRGQGVLTALAFAPDGRRLLSGGADGAVRVWDAATGQQLTQFPGHTGPVHSVAVAASGRQALSAGEDGSVRLWRVTTLLPVIEPPVPVVQGGEPPVVSGGRVLKVDGRVLALAMTSDSRRLVAATSTAKIEIWTLPEGRCEHSWPAPSDTDYVKMLTTADGRQVVWVDTRFRALHVMDLATGKRRQSEKTHPFHIAALAVSPDGRRALLASSDSSVRLWDLKTGKEVCRLDGHTSPVLALAFSADGKRALTAGDFTVRLWDLPPTIP